MAQRGVTIDERGIPPRAGGYGGGLRGHSMWSEACIGGQKGFAGAGGGRRFFGEKFSVAAKAFARG